MTKLGTTQQRVLAFIYSRDGRGEAAVSQAMVQHQEGLYWERGDHRRSLDRLELRRCLRSLIGRDLVESCGTIVLTHGADWSKGRKGYQRASFAFRLTPAGREAAGPLFEALKSRAVLTLPAHRARG